MSSSLHSPPTSASSSSADIALLPSLNNNTHPLNHVNHNHNNHTETSPTNKSLKRSRSPSLNTANGTGNNDIPSKKQQISPPNGPNTSPVKKNRKKRTTTDIDSSLGRHLSADKLHVYRWPTGEPHADLHVLQEQICDYLSLKSFKRKYPDIYRRIVDLHEREYLKSQNVVTETQCDLGLTALKLDEVLELMSTDYPEKCHQFNHVWQQKRRSLVQQTNNNNSTNNNASLLLTSSISNQSSSSGSLPTPQTSCSLDNGDKNRPFKFSNNIRQDMLRSTVDYNTQLQRERLQDRKSCFDLQTMQIHYPANRQFRLPPHLTQIGSYPLALVPGQFQDSYIKYSSDELKYMPINTALYYYPKPLALVHTDRFSQQAASSDEEDEGTSTVRPPPPSSVPPVPSLQRPATPQSPHLVNGIGGRNGSLRPGKIPTPVPLNSHTPAMCHMCKLTEDEHDEELVTCTSCIHRFHPACLDVNGEMLTIIKTYPWQCIDCKSCSKCNKTHDEANMMFCDRCDRGYHSYCVGLQAIPDGSWRCSACDPPSLPLPSSSPVTVTKGKRGRPTSSSRSSPRQQQSAATPPPPPSTPLSGSGVTRVSSRRSRKAPSTSVPTPLSPLNNNHSSNSSSADVSQQSQSIPNSPSVNLVLTRHHQQWTTTTAAAPTTTTPTNQR